MSKEQYAKIPHTFRDGVKCGPYPYCLECGFIYLKNELSQWVMKVGCNHKDHPSYKNKLGLTNPFTKG